MQMASDAPSLDYDSQRHSPVAVDSTVQHQSISSPDFEFTFDTGDDTVQPTRDPTADWQPANDVPPFPMDGVNSLHQDADGTLPEQTSVLELATDLKGSADTAVQGVPVSHDLHDSDAASVCASEHSGGSDILVVEATGEIQQLLPPHEIDDCCRGRPWCGVRATYRREVTEYFEEAIRLGLYPTLEPQQQPQLGRHGQHSGELFLQQQPWTHRLVAPKPARRPSTMQGIVLAPDGSDGGIGLALAKKQAALHPVLQPQRKRGRPSLRNLEPAVASEMLSLDDALKVPPPPGVRPWNWRRQQLRAVQRAEAVKDPVAAKLQRPRQKKARPSAGAAVSSGSVVSSGSSGGGSAVAQALLLAAQRQVQVPAQAQQYVPPHLPQLPGPRQPGAYLLPGSSKAGTCAQNLPRPNPGLSQGIAPLPTTAADPEDSGLTDTSAGAVALECMNDGQEAVSAPAALPTGPDFAGSCFGSPAYASSRMAHASDSEPQALTSIPAADVADRADSEHEPTQCSAAIASAAHAAAATDEAFPASKEGDATVLLSAVASAKLQAGGRLGIDDGVAESSQDGRPDGPTHHWMALVTPPGGDETIGRGDIGAVPRPAREQRAREGDADSPVIRDSSAATDAHASHVAALQQGDSCRGSCHGTVDTSDAEVHSVTANDGPDSRCVMLLGESYPDATIDVHNRQSATAAATEDSATAHDGLHDTAPVGHIHTQL